MDCKFRTKYPIGYGKSIRRAQLALARKDRHLAGFEVCNYFSRSSQTELCALNTHTTIGSTSIYSNETSTQTELSCLVIKSNKKAWNVSEMVSRSELKLTSIKSSYVKPANINSNLSQWCLLDLGQINKAIQKIECPGCQQFGLCFEKINDDSRHGFSEKLKLSCNICKQLFEKIFSSPKTNDKKSHKVNDLFMLYLTECGLGNAAMNKFCSVYGIKGLHRKTFQQKQNACSLVYINQGSSSLQTAARLVREAHCEILDMPYDDESIIDITVSFDGSWHKRGHTSHYGVGAVIDVLTGYVLDYEVLSTYCHACSWNKAVLGEASDAYQTWKEGHDGDECCVNYVGSANAMEVEAAVRIWGRSLNKRLRYTGLLSDGDSKAFNAVVQLQPYGRDVTISKEDCINHAHKRMGTALINLSKDKRLGGRGLGRLTKEKALKLQYYYRFALTNNLGSIDNMREAVWATLFHCTSTDEAPHHTRCSPTWCFYKKAIASGEKPGLHKDNIHYPLSDEVAREMVPVYKRMSDCSLLKRLEKGKTQNPNECLHSVIWSRCHKTVFVGKVRLERAVASAVTAFNDGAQGLSQVMAKMDIEANEITNSLLERQDCIRIQKARAKGQLVNKRKRSQKWEEGKRKRVHLESAEGVTYGAGKF